MSRGDDELRFRDLVPGDPTEPAAPGSRSPASGPDLALPAVGSSAGTAAPVVPQVVVETAREEPERGPALPFSPHLLLLGVWRRRALVLAVFVAVSILALAAALATRRTTWRMWTTVLRKSEQKEYLLTGTQPIVKLQIYSMPTLLRLVKVAENLEGTIEELDLRGVSATGLSSHITVDNPRDTQIIEIILDWPDPDQGVAILNSLATVFVANVDRLQKLEAIQAADYLGRELESMRERISTLEAEVVGFREEHQVVELSEQTGRLIQQVAEFDALAQKERLDAEMARIAAEKSQAEIAAQAPTVVASVFVKRPVHARLVELEAQLAGQLAVYTEETPKVLELKDEIARVQELVRRGLEEQLNEQTVSRNPVLANLEQALVDRRVEAASRAARAEGYAKVLEELRSRLDELPSLESRYADMSQRLETLRQLEAVVASRVEEARIIRDSTAANLSIMQPARRPDAPLPSRARLVAAAGVLLGLFLGLSAALALEIADTSLKSSAELEPALGVRCMGEIPILPPGDVIIRSLGRSPSVEAYRRLVTTLLPERGERKARVLLVASAGHFEGRSTIAVNLAQVAAARGLKVMLVDADLQKPGLSDLAPRLGVALPGSGLEEVLGGHTPVQGAIAAGDTGGPSWLGRAGAEAAPELLGGQPLRDLIEALRSSYDLVVVDTAPVLGATDPLLIAPSVDAVLLVVEAFGLPRAACREALARLGGVEAEVVGAVLNKVPAPYAGRFSIPGLLAGLSPGGADAA